MSDSGYNEKEKEMELEREIYMGALVSPGGGDWEKSIEVPCIILSTSISSLLSLTSPPDPFLFVIHHTCCRDSRD